MYKDSRTFSGEVKFEDIKRAFKWWRQLSDTYWL